MFESLINPPKYRWPRETDRLFIPPVSPKRGTHIVDDTLAREVLMGRGYMRAGAVLIDRCLADPWRGRCHFIIWQNQQETPPEASPANIGRTSTLLRSISNASRVNLMLSVPQMFRLQPLNQLV